MSKTYQAQLFGFGKETVGHRLAYRQAAECVRDRQAVAVVLDMLQPQGLEKWWAESAFPDIRPHRNFQAASTSGIAIGGLQRLESEALLLALIDYFSYAGKVNERLRHTQFVKLCAGDLGADAVRMGDWAELPLASKREFVMNKSGLYSVGPHCDAIHFGRDQAHWPIKEEFVQGFDQLSTVLTINEAENGAGITLWDLRPESRAELDALQAEFSATQAIQRLTGRRSLTVRPRAGQMIVLNTRYLHAVEQCTTSRRTIGAFLLWKDSAWRMFH